MFSTSTQRKHWIFENEKKLASLREEANRRYVKSNPYKVAVSVRGVFATMVAVNFFRTFSVNFVFPCELRL